MASRSFSFFDHLSEPVIVVKKDGVICYENPAAKDYFRGDCVNLPVNKLFDSALLRLGINEGVGTAEIGRESCAVSVSLVSGLRTFILHPETVEAYGERLGIARAAEKELRAALATSALAEESINKRAAQVGDIALIRYAASLSHAWHSMLRVVEHISAFLEPENGTPPYPPVSFDIRERCCEIASSASYLAGEKGVLINVEAETERITFIGYREEIDRLVLNLISNSLKNTGEGGRITINLKKAKNTLIMEVADTGCGIAPEKAARLFRPIDTLRELSYDGTGLGVGLYLVHRAAKKHGGGVAVEKREGGGTKITVLLKDLREDHTLSSPETRAGLELDLVLTELADVLSAKAYIYEAE